MKEKRNKKSSFAVFFILAAIGNVAFYVYIFSGQTKRLVYDANDLINGAAALQAISENKNDFKRDDEGSDENSMGAGEDNKDQEEQQKKGEDETSFCSIIHSLPSSSPMSIWKSFMVQDKSKAISIYWASKNYRDYSQTFQDFNSRLLYYLTPQRLQMTIKSIPRNQQLDKVGEILDIAFKRYEYLKQKKNGVIFPEGYIEPRTVNILVMGGSVTMGVMCSNFNPIFEPGKKLGAIHRETCAWPKRLQFFINHFFMGDIVKVQTVTRGGTNTGIGHELWKYNMIPDGISQQPDILINAYSTNDMHILTIQDAISKNLTLDDMIHNMHEDFIRTVLQPRTSCDEREPPLLLFMDDYIGNEQREIRKTLSINSIGNRLSTYYGFGFMSYADAVRDFIYGDTNEWWFSPALWPDRQIHPGMGAHISLMYVTAYNFLNMVTTYCDRLEIGPEHIYDTSVHGMPALNNPNQTLQGEPRPRVTSVLPPEMTADLSLDDISMKWREAEEKAAKAPAFNSSECDDNAFSFKPCTLNFIGDTNMTDIVAPYLVFNDGWKQSDEEKTGLVPTKLNATMTMRLNVTEPVQTLNFLVMQSYGEKWANSAVEVKASMFRNSEQAALEELMEMKGYHAKNTSESFNYKMDLGENRALNGDELVIDVKMVGGTTFKIMATTAWTLLQQQDNAVL